MDGPEPTASRTGPTMSLDDRPPRARAITRGSTVGRFVIVDRLGDGGSATVFSAVDPVLGRPVAIKVLHEEDPDPERATALRARVLAEAQAMARVRHPNVVTIYDVGLADDGDVFLAVEKVDGGTLSEWLANKQPWREIVRVFCAAGEGLAAAHDVGVIHRDFKPANVLLDANHVPRVTDFGLARVGDGAVEPSPTLPSADGPSSGAALAHTNAPIGTPGYMPPEQYGLEEIDARADVFAFCVSLYRGLYGARPFPGSTPAEIAHATLFDEPVPPPKGTDVPGWLAPIVMRGLARDRAARPATIREVVAALRDDPSTRRARWAWSAVATLVIGAAAAIGHHAWAQRAHACDTAAAPWNDVWDEAHREHARAAFEATGLPYAGDAWTQTARLLDTYGSTWTSAATETCLATRVRGEQSEAMHDLRTACLDDRLAEARALTELLTSPDAKVVESAARAARDLSPLAPCSDRDHLSAAVREPRDAAALAEVRALEVEVARAKELRDAGRVRQAREALDAVSERVRKAEWAPLGVEWHVQMARGERRTDDKAAVADYEAAIQLAERSHLDDAKADAEIALGSFEGSWLGRSVEAHVWMRMADASIARLGGDVHREVFRNQEEAWVYQYEHDVAHEGPLFERALDLARQAGIDEPDIIASAHSGLSNVLADDGKPDLALEHAELAVRTMEHAYGADHPWLDGYLNNLAVSQLNAGHVDEALVSATRARDMLAAGVKRGDVDANDSNYALDIHTRGEVLIRARRFDEAAEELTRARDMYRASHEGPNPDVAYADNELSEALRELGRRSEASRALDDAAAVERHVDVPAAVLAGTLVERARLALADGDVTKAVSLGEQAVAKIGGGAASSAELAAAELALALGLARRHDQLPRVRSLATHAREVFARLHDDARRDEAAALLASDP